MSMFDLNNFWEHTKSQKICKGDYLCSFIVETIDNSQLIKRLMRYNTKNPLATISVNKDGAKVRQPNLKCSLTEDSNNEGSKILYNTSFKDDMEIKQSNYIFVNNPLINYKYSSNGMIGQFILHISVLVSDMYNDIEDDNKEITIKRGKAICSIIDDMLDQYTLDDNKYSKIIGNLEFKLDSFIESRVAKTNDVIVYSMTYTVDFNGSRVRNND